MYLHDEQQVSMKVLLEDGRVGMRTEAAGTAGVQGDVLGDARRGQVECKDETHCLTSLSARVMS